MTNAKCSVEFIYRESACKRSGGNILRRSAGYRGTGIRRGRFGAIKPALARCGIEEVLVEFLEFLGHLTFVNGRGHSIPISTRETAGNASDLAFCRLVLITQGIV